MLINYGDTTYLTRWNAVAQTNTAFGRPLTDSEQSQLDAERASLLSSGVINATITQSGTTTNYWSTLDAANAWVAVCNTFNPPPTTATVINPPVPYVPPAG